MKYKVEFSALVLGLCAIGTNGYANRETGFEISANTAIVSDYVFRGISQSDESFAIQGGFDVVHETGFYAGAWASSVDFNDGDEANTEIDLYAGYRGEVKGVSYDIGSLYYAYPGADSALNYDYWEVYGASSYDFDAVSATVGVNFSPDYFGGSGDAVYTHFGVDVPLQHSFALSGGVGYQSIDNNTAFGSPDYTDWNIGLGYNWKNVNLSVAYNDTDLDESGECADGCDARIVFGISAEL